MNPKDRSRFGALLDDRLCELGITTRMQQSRFMKMACSQMSELIGGKRGPSPEKILEYEAYAFPDPSFLLV